MELLSAEDYAPFDHVAVKRERHAEGEPIGWVDITGKQEGNAHAVRASCANLWDQMGAHTERQQGKTLEDPMTPQELAHAAVSAATIMLRDRPSV